MLRLLALGLAVALAAGGCTEAAPPPAPSGAPAGQARPEQPAAPAAKPAQKADIEIGDLDMGPSVKIVLEAENGKIEPPMAVFADAKPPEGVDGPQGASAGKYVETPEPVEVDPETGKRKELHGGSTTLSFTVPNDGKYYVWLRVWWRHGCANTFSVQPDGDKNIDDKVTDNTYKAWRWLAVGRTPFEPGPFEFKKGEHTLKLTSREDGSVLDQVLVVDDPEYRPTGVEKPR